MVRLLSVYFPGRTLVLALSDGLLCAAALVAATYVWFGSDADLELRYEHGIFAFCFASLVCVLCSTLTTCYDSLAVQSSRQVVTRLIRVLGVACGRTRSHLLRLAGHRDQPWTVGCLGFSCWIVLAGLGAEYSCQ